MYLNSGALDQYLKDKDYGNTIIGTETYKKFLARYQQRDRKEIETQFDNWAKVNGKFVDSFVNSKEKLYDPHVLSVMKMVLYEYVGGQSKGMSCSFAPRPPSAHSSNTSKAHVTCSCCQGTGKEQESVKTPVAKKTKTRPCSSCGGTGKKESRDAHTYGSSGGTCSHHVNQNTSITANASKHPGKSHHQGKSHHHGKSQHPGASAAGSSHGHKGTQQILLDSRIPQVNINVGPGSPNLDITMKSKRRRKF